MNLLMAGMVPTMMILKAHIQSAGDPTTPRFWFVMSMSLLVGFVIAYPMNWWLVMNHLKHGMMTVRLSAVAGVPARHAHALGPEAHVAHSNVGGAPKGDLVMSMIESELPRPPVPVMAALSFLALAAGVMIAFLPRLL
jgi:hypothetical protein